MIQYIEILYIHNTKIMFPKYIPGVIYVDEMDYKININYFRFFDSS